jgi:molybdopterin-binding protein
MQKTTSLDLIEGACLVLISNAMSHGYQIAKQFEVETVLGEVLTLSRPVVYRAVKSLEAQELIRSIESTGVRGQLKWQLKCTAAGERLAKQWLNEPVTRVRDIRSEFVVKILLSQMFKLNTLQIIKRQRKTLEPIVANLLTDTSSKPVAIWRREQSRAVMRFLDELEGEASSVLSAEKKQLQISARNQLRAEVAKVRHGDTLSTIYLTVEPNQTLTSTITRDAANDLSLAPGSQVVALFKATEVMIAQSAANLG